ncbi:PD-(D/E)XK nuclease family protein [Pedobacter sp. ASV12]|uniref:PD-(D/E)XK nuclease family protein n=1 Tax=Pedobacter sp. ASV12 TaxID=2795120 RepID=UPI0018EC355E|nr:PD-(D/E)XK nuclease family protein [Pedobacter sp. ASV12]
MYDTQLPDLEQLIDQFDRLPKVVIESTYLELCKYPGSRFEEICSRLLSFYFNPNNEHGFNDLFLEALLELIAPEQEIGYESRLIEVIPELNSDGKRLDILIKSPDMVIGIENKIYANVYNPLDAYSRQIALYHKTNIFKVILTVRAITDASEKRFIQENNFVIISYIDFFNVVKQRIGRYISQANQKYLLFLYDFIQTIENMTGDPYNNNKLSNFFANNSEKIENLIRLYNQYTQRILTVQKDRIAAILQKIKLITNDKDWWAWEGWDLGIHSEHIAPRKPKIGIEASYEQANNNPLAKFRIYFTTWKTKDFAPYEDYLVKYFPNHFLDKTKDNRVYLHMNVIDGEDEGLIIEKLAEYYQLLRTMVNEVNI